MLMKLLYFTFAQSVEHILY